MRSTTVFRTLRISGMATLKAQSVPSSSTAAAAALCEGVVRRTGGVREERDRRLDRLLTGRLLGYPLMLALLALVFYLTIRGANVLSGGFIQRAG